MSVCRPTVRRADPVHGRAVRGFSLIELFIVVSLLGLFMGAVQETLITGLRAVNAAHRREAIRQPLASALERFARDAGVASNVDAAETGRFQFDTPSVNNVEYDYDSGAGTLTRDDASSSAIILLRNLTAFDFDYVDCQGTLYTGTVSGSSTEDSLRVVQVVATVTQNQETLAVARAVFLRNMLGLTASTCGTL